MSHPLSNTGTRSQYILAQAYGGGAAHCDLSNSPNNGKSFPFAFCSCLMNFPVETLVIVGEDGDLYHSHWEARVLCQCLSDVSRWLWSLQRTFDKTRLEGVLALCQVMWLRSLSIVSHLVKGQLENLKLFGLDRCAWTSSLRPPWPVFALVALGRVVLRVTIH